MAKNKIRSRILPHENKIIVQLGNVVIEISEHKNVKGTPFIDIYRLDDQEPAKAVVRNLDCDVAYMAGKNLDQRLCRKCSHPLGTGPFFYATIYHTVCPKCGFDNQVGEKR